MHADSYVCNKHNNSEKRPAGFLVKRHLCGWRLCVCKMMRLHHFANTPLATQMTFYQKSTRHFFCIVMCVTHMASACILVLPSLSQRKSFLSLLIYIYFSYAGEVMEVLKCMRMDMRVTNTTIQKKTFLDFW